MQNTLAKIVYTYTTVSVAASKLPLYKGTYISNAFITSHLSSWQAHLTRNSSYLKIEKIYGNNNDINDNDINDEVHTSVREEDETEDSKINDFVGKMCGCTFGLNEAPCSCLFPHELIARTHMNCQDMTKAELDLVLLANLEANHKPGHDTSRTDLYTITLMALLSLGLLAFTIMSLLYILALVL